MQVSTGPAGSGLVASLARPRSNRDDAMLGHPPEAPLDEQKLKMATPSRAPSRP
jgi:hypothetical protein